MQVILLERVARLGQMGDVVAVRPGYARNFLLPQRKALRASEANLKAFENRKAQLEARNLQTRKEAEALARRLDGQEFVVIRSASDTGSLYGSVSPRDAAEVATEAGFSLNRRQIALTAPIKALGLHRVTVTLHPEVKATITLNVARSQQEAELQHTGQSIGEPTADEDAANEFDVAELFDGLGPTTETEEENKDATQSAPEDTGDKQAQP